jgi:membrane fusion protein, multidrug efflux system
MYRQKHKLFIPALLLLLAGCNGGAEKPAAAGNQPISKPKAIIISAQQINERLEASGTVLAAEEVALMPEIQGRIVMLNLPEGKRVQKGELLVKLFDGDLQAQLSRVKAQLATAEITEKRQKELLAANGISRQEYDLTVTGIATLKADMAAVQAQLTKTEVRAPFTGVIGLRRVSEGAIVSPGTLLANLRADNELKLDFTVPEAWAGRVATGTEVSFRTESDTTLHTAKIMATEQGVEQGTRTLSVRARIDAGSKNLMPGTFARVEIPFSGSDSLVIVPTNALIAQGRGNSVIVARGGKAEFVKVETGARYASGIVIRKGLQPGDTVLTSGVLFIKPGNPVQPVIIK